MLTTPRRRAAQDKNNERWRRNDEEGARQRVEMER
jgi:hypothetical protein